MPSSSHARMMRTAISPRFAIRTFENICAAGLYRAPVIRPRTFRRRRDRGASEVDAALGLVLASPTALAAVAGLGARGAPDRAVAPIVERVIRKVVAVDVAPDVMLRPVRQWIDFPDPAPLVHLQLGRVGARVRLLPTNPGDPGLDVPQRALERLYLGGAAAVFGTPGTVVTGGVEYLHAHAE